MNLGERYRNLRLALTGKDGEPMSAKEFAKDVVGLATTRVSELENNKREMSLTELKAYHNGLGVSFEYLLGETDIMTINNDIQTACKVTGLSEKAISTILHLKGLSPFFLDVVNSLLETDINLLMEFITCLHELEAAIYFKETKSKTVKRTILQSGGIMLSNDTYIELQRMLLNKEFDKLADDIIKRLMESEENG